LGRILNLVHCNEEEEDHFFGLEMLGIRREGQVAGFIEA